MVQVEVFPSRKIVGLSGTFISASHPGSNAQEVIGQLWGNMSWQFFTMDLKRDEVPLGVGAMWPDDSGEPGHMVYFAGYEVQDFPEASGALETLTIEEGKFAFVVHQGSVEDMSNTVKKFYGEVLPSSGLVRRKGMDLEIYSELDQNGSPSKIIVAAPVQ